MKNGEWWGRNGERNENWETLSDFFKQVSKKQYKLLSVRIAESGVIWRFKNMDCGNDGWNPFYITFSNEDPLIERLKAIQMREELKKQKQHENRNRSKSNRNVRKKSNRSGNVQQEPVA